jgi:hypothetical protein
MQSANLIILGSRRVLRDRCSCPRERCVLIRNFVHTLHELKQQSVLCPTERISQVERYSSEDIRPVVCRAIVERAHFACLEVCTIVALVMVLVDICSNLKADSVVNDRGGGGVVLYQKRVMTHVRLEPDPPRHFSVDGDFDKYTRTATS